MCELKISFGLFTQAGAKTPPQTRAVDKLKSVNVKWPRTGPTRTMPITNSHDHTREREHALCSTLGAAAQNRKNIE